MIKKLPLKKLFLSGAGKLLFLLLFFVSQAGFSQFINFQELEYGGEVNLRGMASSGDDLPFWMYSNQRDRVLPNSHVSTWATGTVRNTFDDDSFLEIGAGLLYRDGNSEGIIMEEIYARYENDFFHATLGRKQRPELYNGLSATNENIIWSLNARPLPGFQIGTTGPVFFEERFDYEYGFGFEGAWSEYLLGDERYQRNARLHHKSLHFVYRTEDDLQIRAGFQHFAHYGGTTSEGYERPIIQGYLDAVTLQHPSQFHVSTYELNVSQQFEGFRLELIFNTIATDRTGRRWGNKPDGRYGIYYENDQPENYINSAILELYTTHHQSHTSTGFPIDDYFNHWVYRSGWSYQDRILGAPFFTYDPETDKVVNNKYTAFHGGIGGELGTDFVSYPYKFLISYARNHGTYENRYNPKENMVTLFYDMLIFQDFVDIGIQAATEFRRGEAPNIGLGVHLRRAF